MRCTVHMMAVFGPRAHGGLLLRHERGGVQRILNHASTMRTEHASFLDTNLPWNDLL